MVDKLRSYLWIFQRLSFLSPVDHISDVFFVLFNLFRKSLLRYAELPVEEAKDTGETHESHDKESLFPIHEFISPYLKHNYWGSTPTDT